MKFTSFLKKINLTGQMLDQMKESKTGKMTRMPTTVWEQ